MKKSIFCLLLAAFMAVPIGASAQDTLTVANGTTTNSYVPIYGLWLDANQHNQVIYSGGDLEDMVGASITGITFYLSSSPSDSWSSTFTIRLGTTTETETPSGGFVDITDAEVVYTGTLSVASNMLSIVFDEEYIYSGDNLLLDVQSVAGNYSSATFLGLTGTAYNSCYSYSTYSPNRYQFTPKTTFTYEPGGDACRKVRGLAVLPSTTDLTLSWIDTLNAAASYTLMIVHGTDTQTYAGISGDSYTFTGLTANTPYTLGVKSVCSADNESKYATIATRTDCEELTIPWHDGFDAYDVSSFPDCWTRISGSSNGTYPYVYQSGVIGRSLYMNVYSSGDTNFVRSQILPIESNNMHISFWLGSNGDVQVGLLTDPTDLSTFTVLSTLNSNGYWRQYDIYTDTVADLDGTTGVYLAFRLPSGAAQIDEVKVDVVSDCRRPVGGRATDVTYNSAFLQWKADEASVASTFDVLVTPMLDPNAECDSAVLVSAVNDTATEVSGLLPDMEYYVWVRGVCADDLTSDWALTSIFTTDKACYSIENLTVTNASFTSAHVSWDYVGNGRGTEEMGVVFQLVDSANNVLSEWTVSKDEGPQTFITGLSESTTYTLKARTLCNPDTADAVTLSVSTISCGKIEGGTMTTNYVPFNANWNYGYSQTLYPLNVVSAMGSITGLAYYVSSTPSNYPQRPVKIWIGETNMTSLTTTSYVDTANMTKVYDGNINIGTAGWTEVNFNTPYVVEGTGANLVVAVLNTTGHYSSASFRAHSGGIAVYGYQDDASANGSTTISDYSNQDVVTAVPDIRFLGNCELSCYPPSLAVQNVDVNSADLVWARGEDEGSWVVQYRATSSNAWTSIEQVGDTVASISGLTALTNYICRVGSICPDGDTMWSNVVSLWTLCEDIQSLPYVDNFDQYPVSMDPICWQVIDYGNSSSTHYVAASSDTNHYYYVYPYGPSYLVSRLMPAGTDMSTLEVNWSASISNEGSYEVGFMTDPTDTNTFRVIGRFGGNNNTWTDYNAYGDTTTLSEPAYVVWRFMASGSYYIDNVEINVATCRRPSNIVTTNLLDVTASFAWHGMEGASYEYCVTTTPTTPADTVELHSTSDTTCTVEGLTGNTVYYFWARTLCDGQATPWSPAFQFRTACDIESTPWIEDFNDWSTSPFDLCWPRYTGAWSTTPTLAPVSQTESYVSIFRVTPSDYITNNYSPFTNNALVVNAYSTNTAWVVSPLVYVASPVILSFDVALRKYSSMQPATYNSNDREFIVAASTDGGTTWSVVASWGTGTGYTYPYTSLVASPTNVQIPLTYTDQHIRLAFYSGSYSYGDDNDLYLDNIQMQSASCMRPTNVVVNRSAESATLSWVDYSTENEDGYEIVINTGDSLTGPNAVTYQSADTFFTVNGLSPKTTYYYYVRSACDETPSAGSWNYGSFRTACLPITLPLDENFDSYTTGSGSFPECWDLVQSYVSSSSVYPYVYNSSRGNVLYFYGYGSSSTDMIAATPLLPAPLNELEISFTYYRSEGSFKVYLATDPYNQSTWHLLTEINAGYNWADYEFSTDTFSVADTGYVVFVGNSGYSNYTSGYLEDVFITKANPCKRPTKLSAIDTTAYTVTLAWPAVDDAVAYRVKYNTENDITTADSIADVSDTSATVEGLHNGTQYYFWVQTVCGEGLSDPRGATFTTEISCFTIENLRCTGRNLTSAAYMWDLPTQGNEAVGVEVTLRDLTDPTVPEVTTPSTGINYHLLSDLVPTHTYQISFYTVCTVDSSAALTVTLEPQLCGAVTGNITSSYTPFYGFYNYGYTQALYPVSVTAGMTQITGISWYITSPASSVMQRTIDVYIGRTTSNTLDYNSPIPVSSMTKVVDGGQLNVGDTGWTNITFNTPWNIPTTGGENFVVAVVNKTGSYSSISWRCHSGVGCYGYDDYNSSDQLNMTAYSNNSNTTTVADIHFVGDCPTDADACQVPVALVSAVDSSSVEVVWTGNSTNYTVQYRQAGDTTWNDGATAASSPATINGLASGTNYVVRVVGTCGDIDYVGQGIAFATDCAPVHIPFHFTQADMQAAYTAGFSPCWESNGFNSSYSGNTYYVYTYSSNGWVALPEIAEPLNTAQVRTRVATLSSGSMMKVGVMEEDGSITWVETVSVPQVSSQANATEMVFYLDSYTGTGNRVVLGNAASNTIYFLDVHVEELESCRHVSALTVSNVTDNSASVSWTGATGQTEWAVYLNGALQGTTTTASYSLTGLTSAATYTVSVSAVCGAGDTSRAMIARFSTECGTVTLPWSENFDSWDGYNTCWQRYSGDFNSSLSTTTSGWSVQSSYGDIVISGNALAENLWSTNKYMAVTPSIDMTYDTATLTFDLAGTPWDEDDDTFDDDDVFQVVVSTDGTTWTPVYSLGADESYDGTLTALTAAYAEQTVNIIGYAGQTIYIGFYAASGASGGDNRVVIDNVSLVGVGTPGPGPGPNPECEAPTLGDVSTTASTIKLGWTGPTQSYEVAIVEGTNFNNPTVEAVVTGLGNTLNYTFEDLSASTLYTVGVRTVCDDGARSQWATTATTTASVGIDAVDALGLTLYPNPASSTVTIEATNAADAQVSIIDQSGRVAGTWKMEGSSLSIDLSGMARGAYYVRLTTADNTAVRKLIVQ